MASASTLARAFISWLVPITTLKATSAKTTTPVATCPIAKLAAHTISSMMFIGLASCPRAIAHLPNGDSGATSLDPPDDLMPGHDR